MEPREVIEQVFILALALAVVGGGLWLVTQSMQLPARAERPASIVEPPMTATSSPPAPSPDVQVLRDACLAELRSSSRARSVSCEAYADAANLSEKNVTEAVRAPIQGMPTQPAAPQNRYALWSAQQDAYLRWFEAQCDHHGYGTIAYRQCRSQRAQDLREGCALQQSRTQFSSVGQRSYPSAPATFDYCRASGIFQPVN